MEAKKDINEIKKRLQKQFDEMMGAKEGSLLYPAKLKYQEMFRRVAKDIKPWGVFFADAKATCKETASTINEHYKIEPDTKKFTMWLCDYVDWQIYEKGVSLAEIDIETALIDYAKKRKKDIEDKINVGVMFGLDGIYTDETLEAIFDRLVEMGWFIGKRSNFVAIFKPERLPQGWQPIEYTKMNGKTPHQSALAALVKLIVGDKVGTGYVWSGFTVNNEPFGIDKNRDSYTGIEKHELKGIDLQLK